MTIVEFLVARLDEGEAAARAAHVETTLPAVWAALFEVSGHSGASVRAATDHIARHDPARVLAQVAAMRAIVELHAAEHRCGAHGSGTITGVSMETYSTYGSECHTLRHLAAIWRDHPDYDPAWAPEGE